MPTTAITYQAMADFKNSWSSYGNDYGYVGRGGNTGYLACSIRFRTPAFAGIPSALDVSVPMRYAWAEDLTFNISVSTVDPVTLGTAYAGPAPGADPGRLYSGTVTVTGLTMEHSKKDLSIPVSLEPDTVYYLILSPNGTYYNGAMIPTPATVTGSITYTHPASTPIVPTTAVLGDTVSIFTGQTDTDYTHEISYSFGAASGVLATAAVDSCTFYLDPALGAQIPREASGTCVITCKTYYKGTLCGTGTASFTVTVPDTAVPSVTAFTATRIDNDIPASWGIYVNGHSGVRLQVTAQGAYGSSIQSCVITGGGGACSGTDVTLDPLQGSSSYSFTATVTDSRGRQASSTLSPIQAQAYSRPGISGPRLFRCDSDGTENPAGSAIGAYAVLSVSCPAKNSCTAAVQYRLAGSTVWLTAGSYTSGQTQIYPVSLTDDTYEVRLQVTDALSSAFFQDTLSVGKVLAEYDPENHRLTAGAELHLTGGVTLRDLPGNPWSYILNEKDQGIHLEQVGYQDSTPYLCLLGSENDEAFILRDLAAPVRAGDAANKAYVDARIAELEEALELLLSGVTE